MAKTIIRFFLLLVLIMVGSCAKTDSRTGNVSDFVPENSSIIFQINDWQGFRSDIENNLFLKNYSGTVPFPSLENHKLLFENLSPKDNSLLCFQYPTDSSVTITFISRNHPKLFNIDSIPNKKDESLKIGNSDIRRITLDKDILFGAIKDSIFIISSSQNTLVDILNDKTEKNQILQKLLAFETTSPYKIVSSNPDKKSNWSGAHLNLTQESLSYRGIAIDSDTIPNLMHVFHNQEPQLIRAAAVTPVSALSIISITFSDSEELQNNLLRYRNDNSTGSKTGLFDSASEVGSFSLEDGQVYFLSSIDPSVTTDALAPFVSAEKEFREIQIKSFNNTDLIGRTFEPLLPKFEVSYVFELDDFFVFTPSIPLAEEIISANFNNATLKQSPSYEQISQNISSASSYNKIIMDGKYPNNFGDFLNFNFTKKPVSISNYPLGIFQYIADKQFGHISFNTQQMSDNTTRTSGGVKELFYVTLKAPIIGNPKIFEHHGPQVVVQDAENTLHFISESGQILWSKSLENPILGDIQFIDINKNGNKQIAFVTHSKLYILDRNGRDIKGFPITFRDAVTQPLAIFDYDNNHNYRFALVQNKNILLYDNQGKTVRGFDFKKPAGAIVQPPSHIRMGNKDYIVFPEENGTLHILNRQGKPRVTVKEKFEFSEIPIVPEDNYFIVIDRKNNKFRISESGEVSSLKLNVHNNYWFTTLNQTKVTLDDNLLRVNGKLLDLPLGTFSQPQIFTISGKTYVAITEMQEKKVYVFDSDNNLLSNFPVFGSSLATIASKGLKSGKYLVARGDDSAIIVYVFQ